MTCSFSYYSVILTTDMLSAWDDRSSPDSIVFTVTAHPKNGRLELVGAPGRRITTFTQVDLAAGRIKYSHDGNERQLSDAFEFEVCMYDYSGALERLAIKVVTLLNIVACSSFMSRQSQI